MNSNLRPFLLKVAIMGRVPGTNEELSVQRYETITQKLSSYHGDVMIGSDLNFNYLNVENHRKTCELLDMFISSGFVPTITLPTRITHHSSTLIDNIHVKLIQPDELLSGIIISDISDHLPIFTVIGKPTGLKTSIKHFTCRPMDAPKLESMANYLDNVDWTFLVDLTVDEANDNFNRILIDALNKFVPEKTVKLHKKMF